MPIDQTANFPVGTIIARAGTFATAYPFTGYDESLLDPAPWFQACDGAVVDPKSILVGYVEDLTDNRFLQGSLTGGITGGAAGNLVDFNHDHDVDLGFNTGLGNLGSVVQPTYSLSSHSHNIQAEFSSSEVVQPTKSVPGHTHGFASHTHDVNDHTHDTSHSHGNAHSHRWLEIEGSVGSVENAWGLSEIHTSSGNSSESQTWASGGRKLVGSDIALVGNTNIGMIVFDGRGEHDGDENQYWYTGGMYDEDYNNMTTTRFPTKTSGSVSGGLETDPASGSSGSTTPGVVSTAPLSITAATASQATSFYQFTSTPQVLSLTQNTNVETATVPTTTNLNNLYNIVDVRPEYFQVRFFKKVY